ncbi:ubiquitin-conjugating enzyme/RWD-like protein [Baffinella frigidus]|nr:ubiquitin-conjugating enzyme/RWD-like protein [Cryptophyta sp. CCMP2293]
MRPESFAPIALVKLIEDQKVSFGISLTPGAKHSRRSLGLGSFHTQQPPAKTAPISRKGRMARIATEMASLAKDLPVEYGSSIFVRVDEDRPDVIKALITGPEDTPYETGLFEFDMLLPEDYPHAPPLVHFATTGGGRVRFNPNLYQDGKVCLSLLGTWPGPSWQPDGTSTLLQVLVSIQGLIMVPQPYFNEPGFESIQGTRHGDMGAKQYNARTRASTLKIALLEHSVKPSEVFAEV